MLSQLVDCQLSLTSLRIFTLILNTLFLFLISFKTKQNHLLSLKIPSNKIDPFLFLHSFLFHLTGVIFCLTRPRQCQPNYLKANACKIYIREKVCVLSTLHPTQKLWVLSSG